MKIKLKSGKARVYLFAALVVVASLAFVMAIVDPAAHIFDEIEGLDNPIDLCTKENSFPGSPGYLDGCGCEGPLDSPDGSPIDYEPIFFSPEQNHIASFDVDQNLDTSVITQIDENVGINTASPDESLHVFGAGGTWIEESVQIDTDLIINTLGGNLGYLLTENIYSAGKVKVVDLEAGSLPSCEDEVGSICASDDVTVGDKLFLHGPSISDVYPVIQMDWFDDVEGNRHQRMSWRSSSAKYKENIEVMDRDFSKILEAEPRSFSYKTSGVRSVGYIAEELVELGLNDLVVYNGEGLPESVAYDMVSIYLIGAIDEKQERLDGLIDAVCSKNSRAEVCK